MTGPEMKTFTEELLGDTIDDVIFYQLANIARQKRENLRPWQILITEDTTKTANSGDDHTTSKALPTDFSRMFPWTSRRPQMVLVSGDNDIDYREIAFGLRYARRNTPRLFVIDHKNSLYFLLGSQDQAHTIHLFYLSNQSDISATQDWNFPAQFHALIPFDVAAMYKGGIDWDTINARMVQQHNIDIREIEHSMVMWDAQLAVSTLGT